MKFVQSLRTGTSDDDERLLFEINTHYKKLVVNILIDNNENC